MSYSLAEPEFTLLFTQWKEIQNITVVNEKQRYESAAEWLA